MLEGMGGGEAVTVQAIDNRILEKPHSHTMRSSDSQVPHNGQKERRSWQTLAAHTVGS